MIPDKSESKYKAITGFSILSKLPRSKGEPAKFFASLCISIALNVPTVKEGDPLERVIDSIQKSQLGVVLVSNNDKGSQELTTVELRDFVRLYREGTNLPETNLKIGNLASSPVLSVRNGTSLEELLKTMLDYKVRRVFISKTKSVISDRDILSFISSPGRISQMSESPESILCTPVEKLPSSQPPFVDSRMNISEASQMMNPDTGDCLVCDRGLVTFWDLVVKLEQSRKKNKLLVKELSSNSSLNNGIGNDKQKLISHSAQKEMSESEKKQFAAIGKKLIAQAFIPFEEVPYFARRKLVDPLYSEQPARLFQLMGVSSAGHKGAIKFSSVDLFGLRKLDESYYVVEWERFSEFISEKLEVMFRAANPNPSKHMKKAFTRFLHNFGLHWTGCYHLVRESKRRAILHTT